jgi:hypothetical protein
MAIGEYRSLKDAVNGMQASVITPSAAGPQHAAGSAVDSFLYPAGSGLAAAPAPSESRPSDPTAAASVRPTAQATAPTRAKDACPACQAKLSAVELKMGRCLRCGKGLHQANGAEDPNPTQAAAFTVHI